MKNCPTCNTVLADNAVSCPKCAHAFKGSGGSGFSLKDPVHLVGAIIAIIMVIGIFMYAQQTL